MPSLYDIDMNLLGQQLLPPNKRSSRMVAWIKALLTPLQYVRDLYLASFKDGSTAPNYAPGTYNLHDRVIYSQFVYESLINANTSIPTDETKWVRVQENFIGVVERAKYNGQKLVLEYALNKRFKSQFRQPPVLSDIYITLAIRSVPVFIVGGDGAGSSDVFSDHSTEYIINSAGSSTDKNFTINIPLAVYNTLDPISSNREGVVRSFVNNYIPAGVLYSVATY